MSLMNDVQEQVKVAMKAGDARRRDALRLVHNALKTEFINKRQDLTPDEEIAILTREAKKRREAIEGYKSVGSEERAEQEAYELDIVQGFLPAGLSEDEVRDLIKKLVAELGIATKKDQGKLMKALMPQVKGRFPGNDVKRLVDELNLQ